MLQPAPHIDEQALWHLLEEQFGAAAAPLEFVPLGEDGWQYRCGQWWLSVRRDLRGHCANAYLAAHQLHESGLDFVLAPIRGIDGNIVHTVGTLPVIVFPHMRASQLSERLPTVAEAAVITDHVRRVHGTRLDIDLPEEDFQLSFNSDLEETLSRAERAAPDVGPYARRTHALLRADRDRIEALRKESALLTKVCAEEDTPFVLTHGDPSTANLLRCGKHFLIADWGGAMWAPPERDWFHLRHLLPVTASSRPEFLRYYQIRWMLSEIAEYTTVFLSPHQDGADEAAMWRRLLRYLPKGDTP